MGGMALGAGCGPAVVGSVADAVLEGTLEASEAGRHASDCVWQGVLLLRAAGGALAAALLVRGAMGVGARLLGS